MVDTSLRMEHVAGRVGESSLALLAWLGMEVGERACRPAKQDGRDHGGIVITAVTPGGAAGKGGLKAGDLILELNDTEMGSCSDLERAFACRAAGTHLRFLIYREGIMRFLAIPSDR